MPTLIYRAISVCAALGYGFPEESLLAALRGRVDAIVCDAGSIDAGPYYLGTGNDFFAEDAIRADYRQMVRAGRAAGCPVIVGSCGMAGGDRNLARMVEIAQQVFAEFAIREAKVAVIRSQIDPEIIIRDFSEGALRPTGRGPELSEAALRESVIVGQMGVHPLITALEGGAQFILAGRCCDAALFAADMVRRGIDAGLAYHAGHILESGALACDPGSPSDCLVAEIYDDGSAIFVPANPARRCTPHSVAAHALHQQAHPQLQFYPEGVLTTEPTRFFARDSRSAGIRNSRLIRAEKPGPLSIKLEAARWLGARKVSLIHVDPADFTSLPSDVLVYGYNGVQATPVDVTQRELGLFIETSAATSAAADRLARLLSDDLLHHVYPSRKATAGNIAYPLSPNLISFRRDDGRFGAIVPGGTRDAAFIDSYPAIKMNIVRTIAARFPEAVAGVDFDIVEATAANPVILLRTVDDDPKRLAIRHQQEIDRIAQIAPPKSSSKLNLDAPDAYIWSAYHLLQNEEAIRNELFPITFYRADGSIWTEQGSARPHYFSLGEGGYRGNLHERTLSVIADHPPLEKPVGMHRLRDMAAVVRSKDAGINRITFDIFFASGESYEAALYSNAFSRNNVAKVLDIPPQQVIGTFFVDACNAIKISIDRPTISAAMDERDVFGAQQHIAVEQMSIPIHMAALSKASSF